MLFIRNGFPTAGFPNVKPMNKAVSLLSGGLDSSTSTAIAISRGFAVHTLTFDYGQRHKKELESAEAVANKLGAVQHRVIKFDISAQSAWGGSSLTGEGDIPPAGSSGIPSTYVPARNTIFLAFAASYAEAVGARHIFIGVSQVDFSGYPDCREDFIRAMEKTINLGTKAGVESLETSKTPYFIIETPLIDLTKSEIIRIGLDLGVDYSLTWSCYRGKALACGECDSCILRLRAFKELGAADPLVYGKNT